MEVKPLLSSIFEANLTGPKSSSVILVVIDFRMSTYFCRSIALVRILGRSPGDRLVLVNSKRLGMNEVVTFSGTIPEAPEAVACSGREDGYVLPSSGRSFEGEKSL